MVDLLAAAPLEGSEGNRGLRKRGFWRGEAENDEFLEKGFGIEGELEERERAEVICDGILTFLGEKR